MVALPAENQRHEPLPLDPLGKRLCLTFPYLWQPIVAVNEAKPQWQTISKYPLRPRVLWRLWQDASQLVGVRFDSQTCYGLIDIDVESPFHPRQNSAALPTIRAALETIGIYRSVLVRSSWSGGLHLYIPLPEVVPTFGLASALKQCLEAQDLPVAQGQLEVFPNCKSYASPGHYIEYNAHRLPLQPTSGSCLLDPDCNPISQDLGRFFEQWDMAAAAQDMSELRAAIATAKHNRRGKRHRQTTVVDEWLQDLRQEMAEGWTDYGQTNHLLKTIACYGVVFEGLKGDALAEFVYHSAINAPGFTQWCRHQAEIQLKAAVWARAAEGYYWRLGDERTRQGGFPEPEQAETPGPSLNVLRSEDARRRIQQAVADLEAQETLSATTTARAKQIATQGAVSLKTLYRHLDLWHPDYYKTIQRSSKTPEPETIPATEPQEPEPSSRSANSSDSKKFYTFKQHMKGMVPDSGFGDALASPTARRLGSTDFSGELPLTPLQRLRSHASESAAVVQLSLPQLLSDTLDGYQVEASCTQAILRGDRDWVLQRLMVLWSEGHQDLIRLLCRLHPAWGIGVGDSGPVEVRQNAP